MKPSSSSTSSTDSGDRVVMLRAVALLLESGTMTWTSIPSRSAKARRSAWSPSAPIPSSFVSKTRTLFDSRGGPCGDNSGMEAKRGLFTIGHSTHTADRFVALLRRHSVEVLCDVRRFPGSRRHPQFNADSLGTMLANAGISYEAFGEALGGRRRSVRDSRNAGWRVAAFRAYADHMESEEFRAGLERLQELARRRRAALMCAEAEWRRCHRRLIADALVVRGWRAVHIRP